MKKQNLKSLSLNKRKVSNLLDTEIVGGTSQVTGYPTSTELTILACTLRCGGTTGPAPSTVPACYDK
jgi:uncharacterized membrane protein